MLRSNYSFVLTIDNPKLIVQTLTSVRDADSPQPLLIAKSVGAVQEH